MSEDKKTTVTNELLYEVLRNVQGDISLMKADIHEIKAELQAVRGHIVAIQTDVSNIYGSQGEMKLRLDRVESRLNLTD